MICRALAAEASSFEATLILPESSTSIFTPVRSMMLRIILPPATSVEHRHPSAKAKLRTQSPSKTTRSIPECQKPRAWHKATCLHPEERSRWNVQPAPHAQSRAAPRHAETQPLQRKMEES